MRITILLVLTGISFLSTAQQKLYIKITERENKTPVPASILLKGTPKGYSADSSGLALIPFTANGDYILVISAVGHALLRKFSTGTVEDEPQLCRSPNV